MKLIDTIRRDWTRFNGAEPGCRFREYYEQRHRRRGGKWSASRILALGAGTILLVGGLAIGWLPGPGGFVSIFGAALLATEWYSLAKQLDKAELLAWRIWGWWKQSARWVKACVLIAMAAATAGAVWAVVSLFFG